MGSTDRRRKQEEFWTSLIDKYEKRNSALEQQERALKSQLPEKGSTSKNEPKESSSACSCSPCMAKKSTGENDEGSLFSLSSADLNYMLQIKKLVDQEKEMEKKIQMLQQGGSPTSKNIAEPEVFKECKCDSGSTMSNDLLEENRRLTDELQDLKLEMKQCIEKIEGPINRQIEKEKIRNKSLENELLKTTKNAAFLQQSLTAETDDLKLQLNDAFKELSMVSEVNKRLKENISSQRTKCKELEEALIDEKLAEAEKLKQLKNAQRNEQVCPCYQSQPPASFQSPSPCSEHPPSCICQCPLVRMLLSQKAAGDKDDTLLAIGKRLSAALKDMEQCPCCQRYIPQDLKDTCKGIKEIVDLVDSRGPKDTSSDAKQAPKDDKSDKEPSGDKEPNDSKPEDESEKSPEMESQTDQGGRKSSEVQAQLPVSDAEVASEAEKAETATGTQQEGTEKTTATETPETKEAVAEIGKYTTEAEVEVAPDRIETVIEAVIEIADTDTPVVEVKSTVAIAAEVESGTDVQVKSEVSIGLKKSTADVGPKTDVQPEVGKETPANIVCSALRSQLEKTCKAICAKADAAAERKVDMGGEGEIKTEIQLYGEGITAEVGAELLLGAEGADDTQVTTTITGSGTLEVITEGPAGVIETTMTYTDSGNVEILTEITEYEEDGGEGEGSPTKLRGDAGEAAGGQGIEFEESGISQGTSSAYAAESAYSADISAMSSKIIDGTFQPQRIEEEPCDLTSQGQLEQSEQQEPEHLLQQQQQQLLLQELDEIQTEQKMQGNRISTTDYSYLGEQPQVEYPGINLISEEAKPTYGQDFDTDESPKDAVMFELDAEQRLPIVNIESQEKETDKRFGEEIEMKFSRERDVQQGLRGEEEMIGREIEEEEKIIEREEDIKMKEKEEQKVRDDSEEAAENQRKMEKGEKLSDDEDESREHEEDELKKVLESEYKADEDKHTKTGEQTETEIIDEVMKVNAEDESTEGGVYQGKEVDDFIIAGAETLEETPEEESVHSIIEIQIEVQEQDEFIDTASAVQPTITTSFGETEEPFSSAVEIVTVEIREKKEAEEEEEGDVASAELASLAYEIPDQPREKDENIMPELQTSDSAKSEPFSSTPSSFEKLPSDKLPTSPFDTVPSPADLPEKLDENILPIAASPAPVDSTELPSSESEIVSNPSVEEIVEESTVPEPVISSETSSVSTPTCTLPVEQVGPTIDTEALKKDVTDALMRANKNVIDALDDANKHVMGALETANRDVNNALAALEDLDLTTKIVQEAVLDNEADSKSVQVSQEPASLFPSDRDQYMRQQDFENRMLAEIEAAKRAAEECRKACAAYMKEQFKLLAENAAAAKNGDNENGSVKPYVPTTDYDECRKACKELMEKMKADMATKKDGEENEPTIQDKFSKPNSETGVAAAPLGQMNDSIVKSQSATEDTLKQKKETDQFIDEDENVPPTEEETKDLQTQKLWQRDDIPDTEESLPYPEGIESTDVLEAFDFLDESTFLDVTTTADDTAIVIKHTEDESEDEYDESKVSDHDISDFEKGITSQYGPKEAAGGDEGIDSYEKPNELEEDISSSFVPEESDDVEEDIISLPDQREVIDVEEDIFTPHTNELVDFEEHTITPYAEEYSDFKDDISSPYAQKEFTDTEEDEDDDKDFEDTREGIINPYDREELVDIGENIMSPHAQEELSEFGEDVISPYAQEEPSDFEDVIGRCAEEEQADFEFEEDANSPCAREKLDDFEDTRKAPVDMKRQEEQGGFEEDSASPYAQEKLADFGNGAREKYANDENVISPHIQEALDYVEKEICPYAEEEHGDIGEDIISPYTKDKRADVEDDISSRFAQDEHEPAVHLHASDTKEHQMESGRGLGDVKSDDLSITEVSSVDGEADSSLHRTSSGESEVTRKQKRKSSEERKIQPKFLSSDGSDNQFAKRVSQEKSPRRGSKGREAAKELKDKSLSQLSQDNILRRANTDGDVLVEEKQPKRRSQDKHGQRSSKDDEHRRRPCSEGSALPSKERWDEPPHICDCPGDCECEICAPEKMAERIRRLKARRETLNDCTCLPDCQCAVCSATRAEEKRKRLPSGDQEDKGIQKTNTVFQSPSTENIKLQALQPDERCHPPDCTCVSCLCDPCENEALHKSRKLCHAKNCRCIECLCESDNLTNRSRHPPECYCLECLCEICPSLQKYEQLAKCEASCFGTKIDIDSEIGIGTERPTEKDRITEPSLGIIDEETDIDNSIKEADDQVPVVVVVLEPEREKKEQKMDDVAHSEDCTCPLCQCPGADLVTVHKKPHVIDCDCPECRCESCPGVDAQTSKTKPYITSSDVTEDPQVKGVTPDQQPHPQDLDVMTDEILQQKLLEMEDENNQRKKEMDDLKGLLNQIKCVCAAVEPGNEPYPQSQRATLENTMSGLQTTLANLQDKCKAKDQMIEALTQELKLRANSKVFNDMLKNIATNQPTNVDYDRTEICASLPRPKESFSYGRPSHRLQKCEHPDFPNCSCVSPPKEPSILECACPDLSDTLKKDETPNPLVAETKSEIDEDDCTCEERAQNNKPAPIHQPENICAPDISTADNKNASATGDSADNKAPENNCLCPQGGIYVDPSPLKITEARQVTPDSLLLKWLPPQSKLVTGYEIDVDGVLKSRVRSIDRTSAIVHDLLFNANINIDLFAVSKNGRCLPPAHTLFQVSSSNS